MKNALHDLLDHPEFAEGALWLRRRLPANHTVFAEGQMGTEVYLISVARLQQQQEQFTTRVRERAGGGMFGGGGQQRSGGGQGGQSQRGGPRGGQ